MYDKDLKKYIVTISEQLSELHQKLDIIEKSLKKANSNWSQLLTFLDQSKKTGLPVRHVE